MGTKEFNQFRGKAISLHSQARCRTHTCPARTAAGKSNHAKVHDKFDLCQASVRALQIIKEFCGTIGAGPKQAQAVIRLAKKNGEWLGFLA